MIVRNWICWKLTGNVSPRLKSNGKNRSAGKSPVRSGLHIRMLRFRFSIKIISWRGYRRIRIGRRAIIQSAPSVKRDCSLIILPVIRPQSPTHTTRSIRNCSRSLRICEAIVGLSPVLSEKTSTPTDQEEQKPQQPELHQNHPNPFKPVTVIGL